MSVDADADADAPIRALCDSPTARPEPILPDVLAPWLGRRSVGPRRLVAPGPDARDIARLLAAARNVSDHGRLRPCRIVVADLAQRERYATAFLAHAAASRGLPSPEALDEATRERERAKAFAAPCMLTLAARIVPDRPDVPVHEQWMSVGASLGALLGAATALGLAGKALSGDRVRHPAVRSVVCRDDELLACFVYLGTRPASC